MADVEPGVEKTRPDGAARRMQHLRRQRHDDPDRQTPEEAEHGQRSHGMGRREERQTDAPDDQAGKHQRIRLAPALGMTPPAWTEATTSRVAVVRMGT
jgi:hypothetical protein